MSVVDVLFTLLAVATVGGYGILMWLGMAPEQALAFVFGGGVIIGLLTRAAIGLLTPSGESLEASEASERQEPVASAPGLAEISGGARK